MRLRVQTIPPLPDLKAWFVPRPTGTLSAVTTTLELKQALCHDIKQLRQKRYSHKMIRLLLDGFELLDNLFYDEVLRDGDLVCIQLSEEVGVRSEEPRKRKREDIDDVPKKRQLYAHKRTRLNHPPTVSSNSQGSSESSSSSTSSDSEGESTGSDTSSTTTSGSESSGESTSSQSSSSESLAPVRPSKQRSSRRIEAPAGTTTVLAAPHVPPGYGKPSTKNRNLRRRLKRQHEREEKEAEKMSPHVTSDANRMPLGSGTLNASITVATEEAETVPTEPGRNQPLSSGNFNTLSHSAPVVLDNSHGDIMMGSLRNKNKKKNFRQTMVAPAVRKIVFDGNRNSQPTSSTSTTPCLDKASIASPPSQPDGNQSTSGEKETNNTPLRVIPPSDLSAAGLLPQNMFVTSVEFGHHKKKRKPQRMFEEESMNYEDSKMYEEAAYEDDNIWLPYGGEEEDNDKRPTVQDSHPQFDWKFADAGWERFPLIQSLNQLRPSVLVCWQGLAINPKTFTPECLLGAGRVEKVETTTVTIRQILRPGTEMAAAFGIGNEAGGEGEPEDYSWDDICGLGWKIIRAD